MQTDLLLVFAGLALLYAMLLLLWHVLERNMGRVLRKTRIFIWVFLVLFFVPLPCYTYDVCTTGTCIETVWPVTHYSLMIRDYGECFGWARQRTVRCFVSLVVVQCSLTALVGTVISGLYAIRDEEEKEDRRTTESGQE